MVAQPGRLRMSVEEYLTLDRASRDARYEYIDGNAYMLAGGTLVHSKICMNIAGELRNALRTSSCSVYTSDARVRLSTARYVYPDISVTCDARDDDTEESVRYPRLIIEVLSPSTEAYDRGAKFAYYRTCPSVEEYVLVSTQRQSVEVYRREHAPFWILTPFEVGEQVKLASLNIELSVTSFYEKVTLPEDE